MDVCRVDELKVRMLPQSHEDFRRSVCVGCHKPGCKRKVSELLEPIVREKIFSGYSVKNKSLPLGVCQGCSRQLKKEKKFTSVVILTLICLNLMKLILTYIYIFSFKTVYNCINLDHKRSTKSIHIKKIKSLK